MITTHEFGPNPSWQTDPRYEFNTGFTYVANVPPKAIGPQMAGALGQFPGERSVLWPSLGAAALFAAPFVYNAVSKRRGKRFRSSRASRLASFGVIGGSIGMASLAAHNALNNRSLQSKPLGTGPEAVIAVGAPMAMLGLWVLTASLADSK